jgi:hypothetical protein
MSSRLALFAEEARLGSWRAGKERDWALKYKASLYPAWKKVGGSLRGESKSEVGLAWRGRGRGRGRAGGAEEGETLRGSRVDILKRSSRWAEGRKATRSACERRNY